MNNEKLEVRKSLFHFFTLKTIFLPQDIINIWYSITWNKRVE